MVIMWFGELFSFMQLEGKGDITSYYTHYSWCPGRPEILVQITQKSGSMTKIVHSYV